MTGDGVDDELTTTSLGSIPTGGNASRIYVTASHADLAVTTSLVSYGNVGTGLARRIQIAANETPAYSNGTSSGSGTTGSGLGNHLHEAQFAGGTTANGWLDATPYAGNPTTFGEAINTAIDRLRLFANSNSTAVQFHAGVIRQVMITLDTLTADEIAKLQGWLAWDGGLQAQLPFSHPFAHHRP